LPDCPDREIYRVFLCSPRVEIGYDAKIPPSNLDFETEISRLWNIPDHQHGIRCKAPKSDD